MASPLIDMQGTAAPKSLVKKLCEAGAELGWIEKSGTNQFHNYKYATEADLVAALRGKLYKRNVFLFPNVVHCERKALTITSKNGSRETALTDIAMDWTFVDGDSGETWTCQVPGCGEDSGDKGVYKAMTGSEKYLLMKAFLIPTGDDPEEESRGDYQRGKAAAEAVKDRKLAEYAAKQPKPNGGDKKPLTVELKAWRDGCLSVQGEGLATLVAHGLGKSGGTHAEVSDIWFIPSEKAEAFGSWAFKHGVDTVMPKPAGKLPGIPADSDLSEPYDPSDDDLPAALYVPGSPIASIEPAVGKKGKYLRIGWNDQKLSCFDLGVEGPLTEAHNSGVPCELIVETTGKWSNVRGIKTINGVLFEKGQDHVWRAVIQQEIR